MVDALNSATGHFDAHDGKRLFYRWAPVESPRALIVVVHGFAEHSGRYQHVFDWLNARGYACLGFDYRGHGRADGKARYLDSFQDYVHDTLRAIDLARARAGDDVPLYLLGHSQGGLIALSLALEYGDQVSGLVISSPFCGVAVAVPAWKELLGRVAAMVAPGLSIPSGLDANMLSHDPDVVQAYVNDPLIGTDARARWYVECTRAQARLLQEAHRVSVPALIMQAGADTMAAPSASMAVFQGLGSPDKRWIEYEGFYHELFNEPEKERVFGDVDDWLSSRLP